MKYPKLSPSVLFLITFVTAMSLSWVQPWHLSLYMDDEMIRLTGLVFLFTSLTLNTLAYR